MAGAHYDRTPAPSQTVTFDQPTFKHIGLHTGGRYSTGRYRFGASYLHYWYLIPTVTDSTTAPPSNFRGHGSNHIITFSLEAAL
jgi:long-subunit fatty acid transport protein